MATHRNPSSISGYGTPSAAHGSSSMSVAGEVHHDTDVRSSNASTEQPDDFPDTGPVTDYAIIPANDRESPEETHGSLSADSRATVEAHLDETEKSSLPHQPLDKLATLKQWTPEFVALFSSVSALVIMVILLVVSHEKPQPDWAYDVNINTLIAILTTLLRAAMLYILAEAKWSWMATPRPLRHVERFDSASRGAWGLFKFLLFTCRPAPTVLGALVVVGSYAIGPFSQQAVKTYRCEVLVRGVARISIAERVRNSYYPWLNPEMNVAAINGLLAIPPNNSQLFQSDVDIVAVNCTLYPCLRHYYGNITNATLNEHLLSTEPTRFSNRSTAYDEYISIIQPCLIDDKRYDMSNITSVPRDGFNWTTWSSDGVAFDAPSQCVRSLQAMEFRGVRAFLTQNLNGSCYLYDRPRYGRPISANIISYGSLVDCDSRRWVGPLFKGGNATFEGFAAAHDNMATAITNHMRVNGLRWSETNASRSYKEGTCHETVIFVRLHGLWLLYPAALLVLTSALLITAYVQSCHDSGRQPIWKSAILPLLFYNISKKHDSDERNGDPDVGSSVPLLQLAELESLADKTIVTFLQRSRRRKIRR
ncbi:hypothetical protein CMUS01_10729 [Colletotrichum musicola]|uniref:Uncharacterized protein n=1 Tax=Colletotrichum musicola TaxID=2175873 RepID=A0A8H6K2Z8_9PEZI|nr:hypothetical protein CMUS01_10729 [Colletotrichum musicola]